MNVAATLPLPTFYSPADDRSLGREGVTLRDLIDEASRPRSVDRGEKIYARVTDALERAAQKDGTFISPDVFTRTLDLLMMLPIDFPLPHVVVESESEVGLDWDEGNRKVVSLTVDESSMVGFSALFGREPVYGRIELAEGPPQMLHFLLERIFPKHQ